MRRRLVKKLMKSGRLKKPGPNRKRMDAIQQEEQAFKELVARLSSRIGED